DVTEHQLVGLAATHSPKELRTAAKQLCDRIDFDGPEPEEQKAYARESLTLSTAENGVKFTGFLANENAELLQAIVHTGARPHKTADGDHDPRPRDKRQADALTTALTVAANAWDTDTAGHGAKANITVTIDLDDLRSATAHATGQTIYGDDLSAATIRRMACDANIIPLVLGSNSEPLDVGRRERLVTRHIRHALIARDHGCVVCAAPPVMCDAHHLTSWLAGGPTSIDNLALLCRRHHVDLHNNRWTITITNGQVHVARPTWADPTAATDAQPPGPIPTRPTPTNLPQPPAAGPTRPTAANLPQPLDADLGRPATTDPARPADADHTRPPAAAPAHPDPPPADTHHEPFDAPEPPGAAPTCPGHPHMTPDNPWGDTDPPTPRTNRWKADEATLTAAARFAVWGDRTPTNPATGPPPFATT
ncbi:HNH endonuclease, partial [Kribbella karoonensis]